MRLYAPKAYLLYTAMQTHVHTSRFSQLRCHPLVLAAPPGSHGSSGSRTSSHTPTGTADTWRACPRKRGGAGRRSAAARASTQSTLAGRRDAPRARQPTRSQHGAPPSGAARSRPRWAHRGTRGGRRPRARGTPGKPPRAPHMHGRACAWCMLGHVHDACLGHVHTFSVT
eukprot:scaffold102188_cov58-Phaeocystis_antarctica.AAC.5